MPNSDVSGASDDYTAPEAVSNLRIAEPAIQALQHQNGSLGSMTESNLHWWVWLSNRTGRVGVAVTCRIGAHHASIEEVIDAESAWIRLEAPQLLY